MCIDIKNIIIYDQVNNIDEMHLDLDTSDLIHKHFQLYKSSTEEIIFNGVDNIFKNTTLQQCKNFNTRTDKFQNCKESLKENQLSVKKCCIIEIFYNKLIDEAFHNKILEKASYYRAVIGVAQSIIYCGAFCSISSTLYTNRGKNQINIRMKLIYLTGFIMCIIDLLDFIEVKTSLWLINKSSKGNVLPNWKTYIIHIYCLFVQILVVTVYFFKNYKKKVSVLHLESSNLVNFLKVIEMIVNPTIVYIGTLLVRFYFVLLGFIKEVSVVFFGKNVFILILIVSCFLLLILKIL